MSVESNPLFSIVTAAYNSADSIGQTAASLECQTFSDFEWIVVDGGSKDATREVVAQSSISNLRFISEPDNGIYDAMNKGIAMSKGRYLAFLNSDDWYMPETLDQVQLAIAANSIGEKPPIIFADMNTRRHVGNNFFTRRENARLNELPRGMFIFHPAIWIPKLYFDQHGPYDLRFKLASDYHWVLRAYISGIPFKHLPLPLANFTVGGRSSQSCESYREAMEIQAELGSNFTMETSKLYAKCRKKQPMRNLKAWLAQIPILRNIHVAWIKQRWS